MNKLIDQYILKKFLSSLFFILSSFLIIFIIVSVIDLLDKFIERYPEYDSPHYWAAFVNYGY